MLFKPPRTPIRIHMHGAMGCRGHIEILKQLNKFYNMFMLTERTSKRKVTFQEPSTTCVVPSTKHQVPSTTYQEPRTKDPTHEEFRHHHRDNTRLTYHRSSMYFVRRTGIFNKSVLVYFVLNRYTGSLLVCNILNFIQHNDRCQQ